MRPYTGSFERRTTRPDPRVLKMSRSGRSTGAPVPALVKLVHEVNADLLVVGDVGLDSVAGRLLGSVPAEVARRARIDILIVHTAD